MTLAQRFEVILIKRNLFAYGVMGGRNSKISLSVEVSELLTTISLFSSRKIRQNIFGGSEKGLVNETNWNLDFATLC